jgi:hypothetical protein
MCPLQSSTPTRLESRIEVSLRSKEQCEGDTRLPELRCADGPAAREVEIILENLFSGEAVPQTVALLSESGSGALVGIASVRLDGNAQIRGRPSAPWFLRRLAANPYVNVIVRDERWRNVVLSDGETRLGSVLVRAALEAIGHELRSERLPTVWALVQPSNDASKQAFSAYAFYPHDRSEENPQEVYVRRAGRPLPPPPEPSAYRPLQAKAARAEHLTA